jgi:hypothetical protein
MHAVEAADTITESVEEREIEARLHAVEAHEVKEKFRNRAALVIAFLAALLAICELAGDNAKNQMIDNNIRASDQWAFYQAKNVRQTEYKLAADQLKRELAQPGLSAPARAAIQSDLGKYEKTAARYEDEPKGDGKKQLQEKAKGFEEAREIAHERHQIIDLGVMVLQIGIVLGSVSILAASRPLLWISGLSGVAGLVLLLDGLSLLVKLPF